MHASDPELPAPAEPEVLDFEPGEDEAPVDAAPALPRTPAADETQLCAWIDRIVDHDERALMLLYDATLSRVWGLVLRVVRRPQLAEEVVEEVFFQVWRQAPRFDASRGKALTWLLGMARSRAIDALRHEARFVADSLDDEALPAPADASTDPGDELLAVARGHADLHEALLLLKPQPRQLVALAFFNGLSHEEIAAQMALPLGTVKSQIRRALHSLRQVLGEGAAHALVS
jgi:RNA polymerase sigma-70 factor (ECF subfamily)